jgi:hypothetical protein
MVADGLSPDAAAGPATRDLTRDVLAAEVRIRSAAVDAGLTLRLAGSFAVWERCPGHVALLSALGRRQYRDLDYLAYSTDKRTIEAVFGGLGFTMDPTIRQSQEFGIKRYIYHDLGSSLKVDIFMDSLVMAHTIDLRGRLAIHPRTLSLVDLVLTKLQIHEITENDLIDLVVLFAEHDLRDTEDGAIDARRLATVLADDWGFTTTVLGNLANIDAALERFDALPADVRERIAGRIGALRSRIEAAPKSTRWKLRARVGARVRWYEDVDEVR